MLLLGAGPELESALSAALSRHRVFVETADAEAVLDAVTVAAPDLVLVAGDAARDCGSAVLARLAASPSSSVVPVVVVDDHTTLDARLRAFRHGATAIIPRSASIDAIAEQVSRLAREVPNRAAATMGKLGEATLEEFIGALSTQLRTGILSVRGSGLPDDAEVRLVLGGGRPLAEAVDQFVKRVGRYVVEAGPLEYEFDERAGGTVQLFDHQADGAPGGAVRLEHLRILLADDQPSRADAVAQELRSRGAAVTVVDFAPSEVRLSRLRQIDPNVLLIGQEHVHGKGYELVRRLRNDPRLRWASLMIAPWQNVWSESNGVGAIDGLGRSLASMAIEPQIAERAAEGSAFDLRLESLGGARLCRLLAACPGRFRVTVENQRALLDIDIADGLVAGASGQVQSEPPPAEALVVQGADALASLLALGSGRVHVQSVERPAVANLMSTVDVALSMADAEAAPIAPSLPAAAPPVQAPPAAAPAPAPRPGRAALSRPALAARLRLGAAHAVGWGWRHGIDPPGLVTIAALAACGFILLGVGTGWGIQRLAASPSRPAATAVAELEHAAPAAAAEPQPAPAPPKTTPSAEPPADDPSEAPAPPPPQPPAAEALPSEPSKTAPSCEALLGNALPNGSNAGAAYEQLKLGRRELVKGDLKASHTAYCRAHHWDEQNVTILIELSRVVLMHGDGPAAAEWARRAERLNPESTSVQAALGDALARAGDVAAARRALLAAASAEPGPNALVDLARAEVEAAKGARGRRDFRSAERLFRRAAVLDPNNVEAAVGLANALLALELHPQALVWAERAHALAPADVEAELAFGDALARSGRPDEARVAWQRALELAPGDRRAARRLARRN